MKSSKPPFKLPLEIEGEGTDTCIKDADGYYIVAMSEYPTMEYDKALKLHMKSMKWLVETINQLS